ncbi:MAG: serine protease [Planctomycetota bacterium]|nr:MAG: serine protease [Planctomycetota bacterium]
MLLDLILNLSQRDLPDGAERPAPDKEFRLRPTAEQLLAPSSALGALEEELQGLYRSLRPALVQVRIRLQATENGLGAREVLVSGIVIDRDDLLVAPGPIPWNEGRVMVVRFDGKEFAASQVAEDAQYGLTLVHAPGLGIAPPPLGLCEVLPEGSLSLGIGNAYGMVASLSFGLIAGKERTLGGMRHLLQVTNSVNPGDGGGLLADRQGQVIAVMLTSLAEVERNQLDPAAQDQAAIRRRAFAQDVSFAVPIERVLEAFAAHLTTTVRSRPQWGVVITEEFDPRSAGGAARRYGQVLVVQQVLPDTAAERAGIAVGDRILSFDGRPVESLACLREAVYRAGPQPEVQLIRNGEVLRLRIELDAVAADAAPPH